MIEAYCVKCRAKWEIKDPKYVTMKNGHPAVKGTCPKCGAGMYRIGKLDSSNNINEHPQKPENQPEPEEYPFFEEDVKSKNMTPKRKKEIREITVRNTKAVKKLKKLYNNKCQISGTKYTFKKKDNGEYYSEAHHLIPLGEDGADNVSNIVILSPLIHRMLHYAKVDGLDLNKIKNNKLLIKINGVKYVITWHQDHAKTIK